MKRAALVIAACVAVGCSDDPSADGGTDGGSSGAGGSSGSESGDTVGAAESSSSSADATGTDDTTTGAPLEVDVSVLTHPQQPMVVDLVFAAPDLTATAAHVDDPGVIASSIAAPAGETRLRVRGLRPDTMHTLAWTAEDPDGHDAQGMIELTTEPALPGFQPLFAVAGAGPGPEGYVLFDLLTLAPRAPASLFAVDAQGVTRWHLGQLNTTVDPSIVYAGAKLRPDGTVLFLRDYTIFVLDELGDPQLALDSATLGVPGLHHDVVELPSGNFLTMSFTFRDIDDPGPGTVYVAGDLVLEVTPDGEVVWEWDAFDHLDVDRRPPGFEEIIIHPQTLQPAQDWTHANAVVYEPDTDSVLLSIRHQDWLVRIDRTTGDVVWRFGDEGDFVLEAGSWPYHQHSPQWQDDGSLLLYDNGLHNPDLADPMETSRAVRYTVDTTAMMVAQVWEDEAEDFMSPIAGDADRLADGTILVTDSSIDFGLGFAQIHARVRKISERMSATPQWEFTTALGTFIYRCVVAPRLPGQAR